MNPVLSNNLFSFVYKLGHCPELGFAEYRQITNDSSAFVGQGWLYGTQELNVNQTGSLVYGGLLLHRFEQKKSDRLPKDWDRILGSTLDILKQQRGGKKIGLALPQSIHRKALWLGKQAGYKQIVLHDGLPNFGHWKQCKQWLILFMDQGHQQLALITSYSNQQFWSDLDLGLPRTDMRRGIINLKLARSLLNLTQRKKIWDPFCGQGRVLVSGFDQKTDWIASDLDKVCLPDVQENWNFAQYYWSRKKHFLQLENQEVQMKEEEGEIRAEPIIFQQDAATLKNSEEVKNASQYAIVTEGYLGKNFTQPPTKSEQQQEWRLLEKLWLDCLTSCKGLKIPEIIFCLPFYQIDSKPRLPFFWPELTKKTQYQNVELTSNGEPYILYSRANTITGHMILKFQLSL